MVHLRQIKHQQCLKHLRLQVQMSSALVVACCYVHTQCAGDKSNSGSTSNREDPGLLAGMQSLASNLKHLHLHLHLHFAGVRRKRCGRCTGCTSTDCGSCRFCLDKPKFGGPGKKKKPCLQRICSEMQVGNQHSKQLLSPTAEPTRAPLQELTNPIPNQGTVCVLFIGCNKCYYDAFRSIVHTCSLIPSHPSYHFVSRGRQTKAGRAANKATLCV